MKKEYYSILFPKKKENFEVVCPAFFQDLQLEGVVKAILTKYREFDIAKFYYTIPNDKSIITYRQDIYKDFENDSNLYIMFRRYINLIFESVRSYEYFLQIDDSVRKGSYLLLTCKKYLDALQLMEKFLSQSNIKSSGLLGILKILKEEMAEEDFIEFKNTVQQAFEHMELLDLKLLIRDNEIQILEEEKKDSEESGIISQLIEIMKGFGIRDDKQWNEPDLVHNLFPAPLSTSPLENSIIDILKKSRPQVFDMLKKFSQVPFRIEDNIFYELKNEIAFYLSFYDFEKQLSDVGYQLSYSKICDEQNISITGVFDIALAWKNRFSNYEIVKNDIHYEKDKSFLVITGPNQGGKTTLARAIGQSIYFMKIGLKVPCNTFSCPYFERILTHFEVEESVKTGAGKLKEELVRLRPMMHLYSEKSFVILNELFTTATTYDAGIMGQKVMRHFIEKNCMGIYVTHICELADEDKNQGVQSMVAQVDKDDYSKRTFKIIPMKAIGLGYSDSIVKKYELDYEQITNRLKQI